MVLIEAAEHSECVRYSSSGLNDDFTCCNITMVVYMYTVTGFILDYSPMAQCGSTGASFCKCFMKLLCQWQDGAHTIFQRFVVLCSFKKS